jgi:hypothetical protein
MTEIEDLPRVGGTGAGAYYEVAPDVILAQPREDYVQNEDGARASLLELHRIARERGRKIVSVVLLDRVRGQDAGARRIWKEELDVSLVAGLALVGSSLIGRAIASFFIGLARPTVPTVMVASLDEAVAWATDRLEKDGGAV